MRKIKYRGKVKGTCKNPNGLWVYGFPYNEEDRWAILYDFPGGFGQGRQKVNPVIPETIGQFTGLKDKNGKEIYEGDILEMKNVGWKYTLVKFHLGTFAFHTDETHYLIPMTPCYWEEGEVVGNIHDNLELVVVSEV